MRNPLPANARRAAEYVRMSTDHQQYSTENQRAAIQEYAVAHGLTIVRTYTDSGKSGLKLEGRAGLKQLLADAEASRIDFAVLLVYDISRWGRFQDADESAYYEFVLKQSGVAVAYCVEPFSNDGTPISTIFKSVKRAMAGEYSRELSTKVFQGQCRLIRLGYRQGGPAGFGLRRMLLDASGKPKGLLKRGERKSLQTERVILVPGPDDERSTVREIYSSFVDDGKGEKEIAEILNQRGILTELGTRWTAARIRQVLTNEKYVGTNVFNRRSFKLKQRRVANPREMWIRQPDSFEALVSGETFLNVQEILGARSRKLTDEELLDALRQLYRAKGLLSGILIDECEALPPRGVYTQRFGSLVRAYQLVGFTPARDYRYLEINAHLRKLFPQTIAAVVGELRALGAEVTLDEAREILRINREISVSVVISRCKLTAGGFRRWNLRFDLSVVTDLVLAIRMDADNQQILDYYVLPRSVLTRGHLRMADDNGLALDAFRFDTLEYFAAMGLRARIGVA